MHTDPKVRETEPGRQAPRTLKVSPEQLFTIMN